MDYTGLKNIFHELKKNSPTDDLTAHIIFTEDSFDRKYSLLSRTYIISSDNKAYWPNMGGYSIFGYCLDGTDQGVRLDYYMADERDKDGWKVEDCYILEQMQDTDAIPSLTQIEQDNGKICYFFGDTRIWARESKENGKVRLEPLTGDQSVDSEWVELSIDRIYGYCTLLSRHLNRTVGA